EKFDPPPSPIRSARRAPEPSPCWSRNLRTVSRISSGGRVRFGASASSSTMSMRDSPLTRRERVDQCRQLARRARKREDRCVDPRFGELGQSLTLGLGGTEQEDLAPERFRFKLERAFAIPGVP